MGRNGRQVGRKWRVERGRAAERQISINSMWSLQPHCGNFYCGPQIKQKGFNLQCHPRLQLTATVFLCVCGVKKKHTSKSYNIEHRQNKAYSHVSLNLTFGPWGKCTQHQLSTSTLVLSLPPRGATWGALHCIFQKTSARYLLPPAGWHADTWVITGWGNLESWIQSDNPEMRINKTERFICCVDENCASLHAYCVFTVWKADEVFELHISRSCESSFPKITGVILSWKTAHLQQKIWHLKWVTEF